MPWESLFLAGDDPQSALPVAGVAVTCGVMVCMLLRIFRSGERGVERTRVSGSHSLCFSSWSPRLWQRALAA